MHFANCAALIAVLFTTLTENLRLCPSAEAGLFLNFEQKEASCSYKIVLIKRKKCKEILREAVTRHSDKRESRHALGFGFGFNSNS